MHRNDIAVLQERIGYEFQNPELLMQALTHSSFLNEQKMNRLGDYERLEFLGDAVLEMISSAFLYETYPEKPEGGLTKLRASLVCEPSLADCARRLQIPEFIRMGKGEELTGGRTKDSIVSDVLEAVIGAMYLDASAGNETEGLRTAREFILRYVLFDIENRHLFYDSKSSLQELIQGTSRKELRYELISEGGPEHDKSYEVAVVIGGEQIAKGKGHNKKAAEQAAAYEALLLLKPKKN